MKEKVLTIAKNMSKPDWLIWVVLAFFCFITFQHGDMLHTGGASIAYLQGHILDFYDYNTQMMGGLAYMPTTYAFFAIWNIPIYLLGWITGPTMIASLKVHLWYKLGTTIVYMLTAYYMAKICRLRGMDRRTSVWVAFLFVSNPIAMYSQFMFGQYDIITVFFMVLGIYFYFKDERKKFIAAFAIAITCKYFALLIFVPMLLMKEKKVFRILLSMLGVVSLFAVETLIYMGSDGFRDGVFGFNATGYVMNVAYNNGFVNVAVVPVLWVLVCGVCYFVEFPEEKKDEWLLYLLNIILFIIFGLSFWHPQWLLLGVPFWTFAVARSKHFRVYMLLDLLLYGAFIIFITSFWVYATDHHLLYEGILGQYWDVYLAGPNSIKTLLGSLDINLVFTVFVAIFLTYTVFLMPGFLLKDKDVSLEGHKWPMRLRSILGVVCFAALAFTVVFMNMQAHVIADAPDSDLTVVSEPLTDDDVYQQVYVASQNEIVGVGVMFATYEEKWDCDVTAQILTKDGNTVLGQGRINAAEITDNNYSEIKFDEPVVIGEGTPYMIRIRTEGRDDDLLSIYMTEKQTGEKELLSYAIVNDQLKKYDLGVVSYYKR